MQESPTISFMWRRGSGIWEESNIRTGESSVVAFVLFFPETWISMLWWATAGHSYFSSFTWKCKLWTKSTAISANSIAQEVEKQVINEPRQWQCLTKCCIEEWNWKEQMRNIGPKEIQVNNRNKSNWTLSLQKGGQIGGWRSGGPSAIMCDENFHQIGTHLFSTHIRFQLYPILPVPKLFWPWKWASKLKSHFLKGSFSQPGWGTRLRNMKYRSPTVCHSVFRELF